MQQILVIDDSKAIHSLVTTLLGSEKVTIHSALDAQSGLIQAGAVRPDLILLDVEMPGMSGYDICRQLKADFSTAHVPVVFLSARATSEEMVRGLNLGAHDYVAKPFQAPELLSRVRAVLRTSDRIRLLEQTTMIDSLTGLGNRARFDERFNAETALRTRLGDPLSCIVLDVDHFRKINDAHGHSFGDEVLRKIGQALAQVSRIEDITCRIGGEEFAVLAPQTSAEQAALLAERMRAAISKVPLSRQGHPITVTSSIGVAEASGPYDRMILDRAHQALYQSKLQGCNRVSIAPSLPVLPMAIAA